MDGIGLDVPTMYGFERKRFEFQVDGFPFALNIWDTSSDTKVRDLTVKMFSDADCVVLIYDLTR